MAGKAGLNVAALATERSENRKLGSVAITMASIKGSCGECPLKDAGCYAQDSFSGMMVRRMDQHVEAANLDEVQIAQAEAAAIDALPGRKALRLHVSGDCKTDEAAVIVSEAAARHTAKHGQPAWSYTHQWQIVDRESWRDVSILASVETPEQIEQARDRGYASAIVVEDFPNGSKAWTLDNGSRAIPCPEQAGTAASCAACRLCWRADRLLARDTVIAFSAHGSGTAKVRQTLTVLNG